LEICNKQLPKAHPTVVSTRLQYAKAVAFNENPDKGIGIAQDIIDKLEKAHGERSWQVADASRPLAEIFIELDRINEARRILRASIEILSKKKGPDHPMTRKTKEVIDRL